MLQEWLKQDLLELKTAGVSLWDGKAKLRARTALPDEIARFAEAKNSGHQSEGLVLVYLTSSKWTADEHPCDPTATPPDS